ncbi:SH3 domain-containing protein [Rheinheimera texasensis]|uniref:SH3 domain-containing protein n=1 Tax=Rheinheimera texasensis TaxID=306205 RepID=UPI0032B2AF4E
MRTHAVHPRHTVLLCLMLLSMTAQGNPPSGLPAKPKATTRQPTPLLAQPVPDAAIVTELPKAAALQVLARQGGWYQVAPIAQPNGWVRLFALQLSKTMFRPDNQPLTDLNGLVLPGHNQVTSSTGVRGLDKVAIESATADFNALVTLQSFQQQPATAEAFAKAGGLHSEPAVPLKEVQR